MYKFFFLLFFCVSFSLNAQITLPANIYGDTLHAPFIYGVASGDPHPSSVIIWTKWAENTPILSHIIYWELASDSAFSQIMQTGNQVVDSSSDFTLNVAVNNLTAGTNYYYRFHDGLGHYSIKGRTKTAKAGNVAEVKVAVFSCSSIYSGFFNAYRRLGEREDIDVAIHLGDYMYDFVDPDEEIRVPSPYPIPPSTLAEYRERHKYYLLDPDLRFARQQHPWIAIWDNHDLTNNDHNSPGAEAFREYLPIRISPSVQAGSLFRDFSFGNLLHIWMTDVTTFRDIDTLPDGTPNIMTNAQMQGLLSGMKSTTATWKMMGSEKMMGGWYTTGIPQFILNLIPNDGNVFDKGSWDGYPSAREMIIDTLRAYQIDNFVAISGDSHISIAMDMVKHPEDSLEYDAQTGNGSIGVEFLPSSISRGNVDEANVPAFLIPTFTNASMSANPQHVYAEFTSHGYGLMTIREDSILAQFCYSPILSLSNTETIGKNMVVKKGENHWYRQQATSILSTSIDFSISNPYPNPANNSVFVQVKNSKPMTLTAKILSMEGKVVQSSTTTFLIGKHIWELPLPNLQEGSYILQISDGKNVISKSFFKK